MSWTISPRLGKAYIYLFDGLSGLNGGYAADNLHRLPAFRREQCSKYRQEFDKNACVLAFLLLEKGLREQYGITRPVEFILSDHGKPYLRDYPHIFFNISHCKRGVICAAADFEIGADIQEIRPYDTDIARRVCSKEELRHLSESADPARLLCKIWTKKESYAKAKGISAAGVLKLDLPDMGFFMREYEDYCISLFGAIDNETDVKVVMLELPP